MIGRPHMNCKLKHSPFPTDMVIYNWINNILLRDDIWDNNQVYILKNRNHVQMVVPAMYMIIYLGLIHNYVSVGIIYNATNSL